MLRNTKASDVRELWIDATLGHAGSQDDTGRPSHAGHAAPQISEGVATYMHDVDIENLRRTVEAILSRGGLRPCPIADHRFAQILIGVAVRRRRADRSSQRVLS
jgi:hypothetical protein